MQRPTRQAATFRARGRAVWWLSLLLSLAIVLGVVGTLMVGSRFVASRFGGAAGDLHGRLVISTLASSGLRAPTAAAFSPDSASLAVIGSVAACGARQTQEQSCGHALAIYASASGAVERVIPLERLLGLDGVAAHAPMLAQQSTPFAGDVQFSGLGWSPDGSRVALVFTIFAGQAPSVTSELYSGLLVVDVIHGAGLIIPGDSDYFAGLSASAPLTPIWNLAQQDATSAYALAPGLAYAWDDQGHPSPTVLLATSVGQLPPSVGPQQPVGNPDGGASFSLWQPGLVIGPGSAGLSGDQSAFVASFPSWSADGAHVALLTAGVALDAPAHGLGVGAGATLAGAAPIAALPTPLLPTPPRDAALVAVQQAVGQYGWALVAWSPDGTTLASVNCFGATGQTLTLRDTASGAPVGAVALGMSGGSPHGQSDPGCQSATPSADDGAYPTPNLTLGWSPNGAQALVADRAAATLTLWRVG